MRKAPSPPSVYSDSFCLIYLLGVFAIGSSSSISFFISIPPVIMWLWFVKIYGFLLLVSMKNGFKIQRFTFFKKCQSITRLLVCYFWRLNSAKDCWLIAVAENISHLPVTHHEFRLDHNGKRQKCPNLMMDLLYSSLLYLVCFADVSKFY